MTSRAIFRNAKETLHSHSKVYLPQQDDLLKSPGLTIDLCLYEVNATRQPGSVERERVQARTQLAVGQ